MIRRKKSKEETEITSLLHEEEIDDTVDTLEEMEGEDSSEKSKKKSGKGFRLPWKKKKKDPETPADQGTEPVSDDAETDPSETAVSDSDGADQGELAAEEASSSVDTLGLEEDVSETHLQDGRKITKKKIAIIAVILLAAIGVAATLIMKNMDAGDDEKVYVESVADLAGLNDNGAENRYTAEVEAQDTWKITLDADMSVEKCYVSVGDEVKKGDKLFSYNTEELKLNQEKKELEVETMESENTQLTKDIASYQADLSSATASEKIELQTQILTAQTTIKKNEFSIKSGKEEIEKIKKNITDATVTSKMDGVIKKINASLGESSSDDDEGSYDTSSDEDSNVYMMILSVGDYRVKGKISETNMNDLSEGNRVIVRSRVDDTTWKGEISSIKTDATADSSSSSSDEEDYYYDSGSTGESASNYYFYVELDSADGLLMGQHVFVENDMGQDETKEGIWISSAYIIVEEDAYYVWADNGRDRLEKRAIEVGEYNDELDEYQVLSGIDENDYIACDDLEIEAGMKTTKVDPYLEGDEEYDEDFSEDGEDYMEDYEDYEEEEYFDEDEDGLMDEEYYDDEDSMDDYEEVYEDEEDPYMSEDDDGSSMELEEN